MPTQKEANGSLMTRRILPLILVANLAIIVGLSGVCLELKDRANAVDLKARVVREVAPATPTVAVEDLRLAAQRDSEAMEERTLESLQALEERILKRVEADRVAWAHEKARLHEEQSERDNRTRLELRNLLSGSLEELDTMWSGRFDELSKKTKSDADTFRQIQQQADHSIFLIHSRFRYTMHDDGITTEHRGTGWGTGFVISKNGHLVTNKHVVHPWKFDPDLMAMEALGDVKVLPETLELYAWSVGESCVTAEGKPRLDTGFSTGRTPGLRLVTMCPDSFMNRTLDTGYRDIHYRTHALDNQDLVLLKLPDGDYQPLRLADFGEENPVNKLDPVMALGFPRGQKGLEKARVESSGTLGVVRKMEETIQITASVIPGNSGGPVFNLKGEVVGIATRIYSETLGICIKIDHAQKLLESVTSKSVVKSNAPAPQHTPPTR